jgi:very-short-patch-repair endonuclease
MNYRHNKQLVSFAKSLRKSMTKEERHLWYDFLKGYEPRFLRQKIIGNYIVDFYCPQAKIVVELDGSQHFHPGEIQRDSGRSHFLAQYQICVIRIPNNEVISNFRGVCEYIDSQVRQSLSHFASENAK